MDSLAAVWPHRLTWAERRGLADARARAGPGELMLDGRLQSGPPAGGDFPSTPSSTLAGPRSLSVCFALAAFEGFGDELADRLLATLLARLWDLLAMGQPQQQQE